MTASGLPSSDYRLRLTALISAAGLDLRETAPQVAALDGVERQRERGLVRLRRFLAPSQAPREVGARRVIQVVAVELARGADLIDERKAPLQLAAHRDRHGPVQ